MFSNKMIAGILIPVVLEQLLNSIMGTADTMMVSNIGSAAISAVSLVDSINILVIQAFSALAAGGAIVCSQYIGQQNKKMANESARQVLFIITAISIVVSVLCLGFKKPLLRLIFGSVEADVMRASETYFFYTAISFPFIAAYDSAASIFLFEFFYFASDLLICIPFGSGSFFCASLTVIKADDHCHSRQCTTHLHHAHTQTKTFCDTKHIVFTDSEFFAKCTGYCLGAVASSLV